MSNNPFFIFIGSIIIIAALAYVVPSWLPQAQEENQTETVQLFYYNPDADKDEAGNIKCSKDGLQSVDRVVARGISAEDAVRLLIKGGLTNEERGQGITTEFPLPGVELIRSTFDNGILTLTFSDPQNKTGGGSCRVSILWSQIHATAEQFPGVSLVRFMPEELFQP